MKLIKIALICFSLIHLQLFQAGSALASDSGTATETKKVVLQKVENEKKAPGLASGHIFTAIQMIVIGLLAPIILKSCPGKASTWVYGTAALFYVGSELITMGKFKKGSEEEMAIYQDEDTDKQIESLEKAAGDTEEAASAAHRKALFSKTAATMYLIAGIVALLENLNLTTSLFQQKCAGKTSSLSSPSVTEKIISQIIGLFIPESRAVDPGVISGIVGGVASAILVVTVAKTYMEKTIMVTFKESGIYRAYIYSLFSAIGFVASSNIKSAAEELDKRAKQYRNLSQSLKLYARGGVKVGGRPQFINQQAVSRSIKNSNNTASSNQSSCITGAPGQLRRDPNCLCKRANNCKSPKVPKIDFKNFGAAGIINNPLGLFKSSATSLFGGDLKGAQTSAAGVSKSAGQLNRFRQRIIKKINQDRKSHSKGPIDFEKEEGRVAKAFSSVIQKGLGSLSPKQARELANISPTLPPEKKDKRLTLKSLNKVGPSLKSIKAERTSRGNFGFLLDDDNEEDLQEMIDPNDIASGMQENQFIDSDIRNRPDQSIFRVITTRYMKSAYPHFFEENNKTKEKK